MSNPHLCQLRDHLRSLSPGAISDVETLERLLARCWHDLDGADDQAMEASKLHGRLEAPHWKPPRLTFQVERHGGTVRGSTRAEVQSWEVDVDAETAQPSRAATRQVHPMSPRMDVVPLAGEIADAMVAGGPDDRLHWHDDRSVGIRIGRIIPDDGSKQTVASRRKRFRKALEALVATKGWRQVRPNLFRCTDAGQAGTPREP